MAGICEGMQLVVGVDLGEATEEFLERLQETKMDEDEDVFDGIKDRYNLDFIEMANGQQMVGRIITLNGDDGVEVNLDDVRHDVMKTPFKKFIGEFKAVVAPIEW